jgi:hypothetical protein
MVFCSTLTQDCAALVLGYSRFSLRENDRRLFHPLRVGNTGAGLLQNLAVIEFFRSL